MLLVGGIWFAAVTATAAVISEISTETYHHVTAPSPVKVTLSTSRSGPRQNLRVQAASSQGIGSVSSADSYLFQRAVDEMPPPPPLDEPDCEQWRAWAKGKGGIDVGSTFIELYVSAANSIPVILDKVEVKIIKRGGPAKGVFAFCPIQYLRLFPRLLDIDLDQEPPTVAYTTERGLVRPRRPSQFRFALRREETEDFQILAHSSHHYVAWRLKLGYLADGTRHHLTISDENGLPFQTTSSDNALEVGFSAARGWKVAPPNSPIRRPSPLAP